MNLDPDCVKIALELDRQREACDNPPPYDRQQQVGILVPSCPLTAENVAKCYGISVDEAMDEGYRRAATPWYRQMPDHADPSTGQKPQINRPVRGKESHYDEIRI